MDDDATSIGGLLDSALTWELTDDGWHRVEEILALLSGSMARADTVAIRRATAALMLSGPRRVATGLNDALQQPPRRPVPPRTRDVINRLLRRIGPPPEHGNSGDSEERGDPAGSRDERAPDAGRDDAA